MSCVCPALPPLQPNGPGRYVFELGCQQSGDYVLEERLREGEEEDQVVFEPQWRGAGTIVPC